MEHTQSHNFPIYVIETGKVVTLEPLRKILNKGEYTLIIKEEASGFNRTGLDCFLKQEGISELVLMGMYSTACVLATGKDAVKRGYKVITSSEIIGNNKEWGDEPELFNWYKKDGRIIFDNYEDIIQYLEKTKEN